MDEGQKIESQPGGTTNQPNQNESELNRVDVEVMEEVHDASVEDGQELLRPPPPPTVEEPPRTQNNPSSSETGAEAEATVLPMETDESNNTSGKENKAANKDETKSKKEATPPPLPLEWTKLTPDPEELSTIRYPSDVCDFAKDETYLEIIGTSGQKITHMGKDLMNQVSPDITHMIFRSHLIHKMEGIRGLHKLELLELYDNSVEYLEELEGEAIVVDENGNENVSKGTGFNLHTLDMSYNVIRSMEPVQFCPNLIELCKCVIDTVALRMYCFVKEKQTN